MKTISLFFCVLFATFAAHADVPGELCSGRPPTEQARCRQVCAAVPANNECMFIRRFGTAAVDALKQTAGELALSPPERARKAGLEPAAVSWIEGVTGKYLCGSATPEAPGQWLDEAIAALKAGRTEAAQPLLAKLTEACGPDHLAVDQLEAEMSSRLGENPTPEQWRAAAARVGQRVAKLTRTWGEDHEATLSWARWQGELMLEAGDVEGARVLLRRTLIQGDRVLGPAHQFTRYTLGLLASVAEAQRRPWLQERLLTDLLRREKHALGAEHPGVGRTLRTLATLKRLMGKHEDAHRLASESVNILKATLGAEHPDTLWAMLVKSNVEYNLRHYAVARPLLEALIEASQRTQGAQSETACAARYLLGLVLWETEQQDAAAKILVEVLPLVHQLWGPEHDAVKTIEHLLSTRPERQPPARTVVSATEA